MILYCLRYEEAFACALLPIHMAISGGGSNVAQARVNIPCAKNAGIRQWRVALNADAFRTRTVDGLKDGGRNSPTPPSFLVTLISPTVALIWGAIGRNSVNRYFDRMLTNSASQTVDGVNT